MDNSRYSYRNDDTPEPRYAPIAVSKFILLYVSTFGLYSIIWFYRNWRYVKQQRESDIWPIPRAVFCPLTYYPLLLELRHEEGKSLSGALAIAWIILLGASNAPDPYWLLSFASFLPLLPAVLAINELNRSESIAFPPAARWRARNIPVATVGGLIVLWIVGAAVLVFPSYRVAAGDELHTKDLAYLSEIGMVQPNDEVLYFYSGGMFSIRGDGNVLTEQGVGAYWADEDTGEITQAFVKFQDILDADVIWSESWLDDTILRIWKDDSTGFAVVLSADEGGDSIFVSEFERRSGRVLEH